MLLQRLKFQLHRISNLTNNITRKVSFSAGNIFISIICLFVILSLSINIVNTVNTGLKRYKIIEEEKTKLNKLQLQSEELKKTLTYKSSDDYIIKAAMDELNLAFEGSKIYNIKEDKPEEISAISIKDSFVKKEEKAIVPLLDQWIRLFLE